MAVNFRIQRHRKNDELHLNLIGDFDGSSAMELLHELRRHVGKARKIYVHTCFVSSMMPFGEEVFKKQFRLSGKNPDKLVFTGRYGNRMVFQTCA